jgi:2-polyprenyl-3-methyl-5-hydroxy-6-metoxy-1,4-benzoquinol methylase
MNNLINEIYKKIEVLSPMHAKKLRKNIAYFDDSYYLEANSFLIKYSNFLASQNKTIDYAIDCYLNMIGDVTAETIQFLQTDKYSSTTFQEVNKRVYDNPETMEYYMHGLLMSQFLWKHHYQIFNYFTQTLPEYKNQIKNYLEIGAGHGLYLSKAIEILDKTTNFSVVDISNTSIELAKNFVNHSCVTYNVSDIFDFDIGTLFDFITMGEVLEHVEDPLKLLSKLNNLLTAKGIVFVTTPTNAPAIDHIYLFRNVEEIRALIKLAGFDIISEKIFFAEDVTAEDAEKFKVTILYGAFLKKSG